MGLLEFLRYPDIAVETVDGRNLANQLRLVVHVIIFMVLYISGGCLGFLNHQQYVLK